MRLHLWAAVALSALAAIPAAAANLSGRLTTLVYSQQRFDVEGDSDQLPLLQFLSLDADHLGVPPLSFHLDGFAKLDLRERTYGHDLDGTLTYAYLQWYDPTTGLFARAGRHFVRSGVATTYLDGASLDWMGGLRLGVQLYAGQPVDGDLG
ncbi:MAG: hypothetical protein D6739_05845, partial [Nitrospirae bacterium]